MAFVCLFSLLIYCLEVSLSLWYWKGSCLKCTLLHFCFLGYVHLRGLLRVFIYANCWSYHKCCSVSVLIHLSDYIIIIIYYIVIACSIDIVYLVYSPGC
jgi:hypothetical protein